MRNFLKQNKGIAVTDALIAILIISLFTGLIATILYNIYISNTSLKRMTTANSYIVEVLEYTDKLYYDNVTTEDLIQYFNNKYYNNNAQAQAVDTEQTASTPYEIVINVQKYNETQGNTEKLDLVKQVTVTVNYKVGNRNQKIEVSRIKARENLEMPNKPDLSMIELQENEKVHAVKLVNENYVVCSTKDKDWYNYNVQNPRSSTSAKVIITDESLSIGEVVSAEDYHQIRQWIPRYVEDAEENIIFLYSNTNSYVEQNEQGYNQLTDSGFDATSEFQNKTGKWDRI